MKQSVLEVKNLTKIFGKFKAVDDISFSLHDSEVLGLLGVNGAGKTTTIQMLLGILTPTDGTISYFGKNFQSHREEILEKVNFSTTYTNLPWRLTVRECLVFVSYLYTISDRKKRIDEIVTLFRLGELLKKDVSELSAGQNTRLNLAKAFINHPKVLLLDEPTASLDPEVANYIRDFLLEQKSKHNISIIFTSHNMAEVEEVCDRVLFIDKGKIIADNTPENLARSIQICHVSLVMKDGMKRTEEYCRKRKLMFKTDERRIVVDVKEKEIATFLRDIMDQGIVYNEISIDKPSLEDYFMQVATKTEI